MYIVSKQSIYNVAQVRCLVEVDNLNEELSKSRDVATLLRLGMDATQQRIEFIEKAHKAKEMKLGDRKVEERIDEAKEDQRNWFGKIRVIEEEKEILSGDFYRGLDEISE